MTFGSLEEEEGMSAGDSSGDDARGASVAEARARPAPRGHSQGGSKVAACRSDLPVGRRCSHRSTAGREGRRVVRNEAKRVLLCREGAGSVGGWTATPQQGRSEDGSLSGRASPPRVCFGALEGEEGWSAGDGTCNDVSQSLLE